MGTVALGIRRSPSPDRSRSPSAESDRTGRSQQSNASGSNRSRSVSRSRSRSRSRSGSPASNRSRSRSGSAQSGKSLHSRSSVHSEKSGRSSRRSGSRSPSQKSVRSGSRSRSRSRSRSAASNRSGSNASNASNRSKSRSRSRSRSRSGSPSHKSRSRSGSAQSNRSHRSNHSTQSGRSGSKTPSPDRRSQSKSKSPEERSRSRSGSHSPHNSPKTKESKGSDSEDDKGADAADLFGDADDISSDEDKAKESTVRKLPSDDEDDRPEPMDRDDRSDRSGDEEKRDEDKEGEEAEIAPETRIDVKIPKISCDLGKEIHFVKLPNFLSVETRPFDPETYEDEIDEEETLDEEGRARLKLKVENTMRWREEINKDGDFIKHSNARLVRWSDGSLSLHLGSEIFDVYKQPLQGDHNHLFIRQGTGLQGQAVFRTKLSFRPHSTESFTHRKMTLSLADRSQKTSGIKILSQVGIDPDQDRKSLLKKEEEKLRQTFRQTKPRKRGEGNRLHAGTAYREEDGSEDEGTISLNAIKNKYKSSSNVQSKGGAIYSSDEEGSDFEARRMKKLDKPKALKDSESSEESD